MNIMHIPHLVTHDKIIDDAFRIALGDLAGNIVPFKDGLLVEHKPVVLAGLIYDKPWTRDAAINTWNGAGLLFPTVTRDTLLSVLESVNGASRIGGQYWDAIIWSIGAWHQYLFSGDREFLALALEAVRNSLIYFEETEFDTDLNLFRGASCYGDGVAAYPDIYAETGGSCGIADWPKANPHRISKPGFGLPMHALSTNCLYYEAYEIADRMAKELNIPANPAWKVKAVSLKEAINRHFWDEKNGLYLYMVDPFGNCDHQEGIGHCFALLFDIAGEKQAESVMARQHITPAGIPCIWPTFPRYELQKGVTFGRHSGTVWPPIQGFWASAALRFGKNELFEFELRKLAEHACRDSQFAEVYHPITGSMYGGLQEEGTVMREFASCPRQTWSATAYLRMIFMGVVGMDFAVDGVRFTPRLPKGCTFVTLNNLPYREMVLSISITGTGTRVASFSIDGRTVKEPFLPASGFGDKKIEMVLH